jgi:hypothetical protein
MCKEMTVILVDRVVGKKRKKKWRWRGTRKKQK